MDNLIKEIESSLDNRNYLSALSLTLTLPDICGKIAYPKIKKSGKRYARWYDEYIYNYEVTDSIKELDKLDGWVVYKLRCVLLHDGSIDIKEDLKKKYEKAPKELKFELTDLLTTYNKSWEENEDDYCIRIRIGIIDFCRKVYSTAKIYYDKHSNQDIFNEVIIFDNLYHQ